jgi:uncharacterized coiled-coil protein SlyX
MTTTRLTEADQEQVDKLIERAQDAESALQEALEAAQSNIDDAISELNDAISEYNEARGEVETWVEDLADQLESELKRLGSDTPSLAKWARTMKELVGETGLDCDEQVIEVDLDYRAPNWAKLSAIPMDPDAIDGCHWCDLDVSLGFPVTVNLGSGETLKFCSQHCLFSSAKAGFNRKP